MASYEQKIKISLGSAALFAVVNSPQVFNLVDRVLPLNTFNQSINCPTNLGLIIHALVFFGLSYFSMRGSYVREGVKIKHSLYGALIAFLVANPATYSFTSSILGRWVASPSGCPTMAGLLLHAAVYCAALVGVMYLPEGNK
jgi:hypothetical protein